MNGDKKTNSFSYITERAYPYFISFILTITIYIIDIKLQKGILVYSEGNDSFEKMVENSINIVTIIIGFLGALLPVILSMKNEEGIVNYLFEEVDKDQLFKKYIFSTIYLGVASLFISSMVFLRTSYSSDLLVYKIIHLLWIFLYSAFLLSTLRSMTHMVNVIFIKKNDSRIEKERTQGITLEEENELINMYSMETQKVKKNGDKLNTADEIRQYKELLDDGIITEEDFNLKKQDLLSMK